MEPKRCLIGFDGFTDEIVQAVEQLNEEGPSFFKSIDLFAERIKSFSEKSGNIELCLKTRKIGGNAPILANALIELGHPVTLAGCLGAPKIEPLFLPLQEKCEECISFAPSGRSDAIEFSDGKVIFGKMEELRALDASAVLKAIPHFGAILERSTLFASVNWTMLPMMNALWNEILEKHAGKLSTKTRYFFVDLADPEKRSDRDLTEALLLLGKFEEHFHVILGLNEREAKRVAFLLDLPSFGGEPEEFRKAAEEIKRGLKISRAILHKARYATDGEELVFGRYTETPQLKTGAGDNFNAGFVSGLLDELSPKEQLKRAMGTAGYYVRKGKSPTKEELAQFLQESLE